MLGGVPACSALYASSHLQGPNPQMLNDAIIQEQQKIVGTIEGILIRSITLVCQ